MSEITLYVDGACRGNPGLGGWGAYIIQGQEERKLCGGEPNTTNNRMELTAAIEGILACPKEAKLIIWTDSNYVKRGITEWIEGWKKKNWKDVKNPDLWKKLDATCQGRQIEWNWIKGHAGHAGNEMADQLANEGADQTLEKIQKGEVIVPIQIAAPVIEVESTQDKKKQQDDWLLNDPFGFDLIDEATEPGLETEFNAVEANLIEAQPEQQTQPIPHYTESEESIRLDHSAHEAGVPALGDDHTPVQETNLHSADQAAEDATSNNIHPAIKITPATRKLQGPRQLILDTETTGFYYSDGDRIIEVGAIEMINRKLTGSSIHIYINPKKPVGDSENVHGISDDFLKDKPVYAEIADTLYDYLKGAEIIAHNATFDMNFLDMEFTRAGYGALSDVCTVTDTLAMAKSKHPGQKNSLDALVRRYEVPQRDRTFHGALLDAEILADVYLAMTGGQVSFDMDALSASNEQNQQVGERQKIEVDLPVIYASEEELAEHENWVKKYQEKHGEPCLFAK